MDPETSRFELVTPETPADGGYWPLQQFRVGEEIEVKGVVFVVQRITAERLILQPKPLSVREIKERERAQAERQLTQAFRLAQRVRKGR